MSISIKSHFFISNDTVPVQSEKMKSLRWNTIEKIKKKSQTLNILLNNSIFVAIIIKDFNWPQMMPHIMKNFASTLHQINLHKRLREHGKPMDNSSVVLSFINLWVFPSFYFHQNWSSFKSAESFKLRFQTK